MKLTKRFKALFKSKMAKDYELARFLAFVVLVYPTLIVLSSVKVGADMLRSRKDRFNESFERGKRERDY